MGEEMTLDLKDLMFILKKRVKLIASVTAVATVISIIVSFFFLTPVYEAKSSIVVGAITTGGDSSSVEYSDVMMYQKIIKTFATIATREDTAQDAIIKYQIKEDVKVEEDSTPLMSAGDFVKMLSVSPQADTQIINIKVQNEKPEKAAEMVQAIGESFMKKAGGIFPSVNIDIIDSAKVPENPVKPNKTLNVAIAFFLGLMVSIGICFLLEFLDGTVKSQEEVERILDLPVLGGIPRHDLDL